MADTLNISVLACHSHVSRLSLFLAGRRSSFTWWSAPPTAPPSASLPPRSPVFWSRTTSRRSSRSSACSCPSLAQSSRQHSSSSCCRTRQQVGHLHLHKNFRISWLEMATDVNVPCQQGWTQSFGSRPRWTTLNQRGKMLYNSYIHISNFLNPV